MRLADSELENEGGNMTALTICALILLATAVIGVFASMRSLARGPAHTRVQTEGIASRA